MGEMNKNICHIISHSHWDREWYLPYEKHHIRLIHLMDSLLDLLEKDENFTSFHLDGQTIILDDYLQVRPEKKDKLSHYIKAGKIVIGPWYILQDEFLTSSEANIRNLQIGHKDAREYGVISKLGYFPDSFGNMGQAPQILKQAGIQTAVFGRGVKPTGFNNQVASDDQFESPYSEMIWKSPDGSSVLGVLFANWYNNGMEIPTDKETALVYWGKRISDARQYASTEHLLFMNGCDHQPVQQDLSLAIQTANELYPDTEFIHSNFEQYIDQLNESLPMDLKTIEGELRSQHTDGWGTLVNTASARVYLKQMNQKSQTLLEKIAEPLASVAAVLGKSYPDHLLTYAWKTLMQNHPHDSICGCSLDDVHREMVVRFEKSLSVGEEIVDESLQFISNQIDTSVFGKLGSSIVPFSVFNTTGWNKTGVVTVELDIERFYFKQTDLPKAVADKARNVSIEHFVLVDTYGNPVAFSLEDLGSQFGYDLPEDQFRQPYMARRVRVTFEAQNVPALGYTSYALIEKSQSELAGSLVVDPRKLENGNLIIEFSEDGSFSLTDKQNGKQYHGLGIYENTGDIGNEYMYMQPVGEGTLTTKGLKAKIEVTEDTPYRATVKVTHEWNIPKCADRLLSQEIQDMVLFKERTAKRVEETVDFTIHTYIQLEKSAKAVKVKTSFLNQATDHRLRVLFPTDIRTQTHEVDSIFEVAKRDNTPASEWKNPSNCQHQQAFVSVNDGNYGLTIANKGLNEYEILQDGHNTIAVTLLRAVAELGDWGVFLTPEAQCLGLQTVEFEIIPHRGNGVISGEYQEAYQYQIPFQVNQLPLQTGSLPAEYGLLKWESPSMALSNVKINHDSKDLMVRWFNMTSQECELVIDPQFTIKEAYKSTILEEKLEKVETKSRISPAEIITLGIKYKR